MSEYTYISIFIILFGIVVLVFRKKILKIQGPSVSKYHFSEIDRNRKMVLGGVLCIVFGLILLIKSLSS